VYAFPFPFSFFTFVVQEMRAFLFCLVLLFACVVAEESDGPKKTELRVCGVPFEVVGNLTIQEVVGSYLDQVQSPTCCISFFTAFKNVSRAVEFIGKENTGLMRIISHLNETGIAVFPRPDFRNMIYFTNQTDTDSYIGAAFFYPFSFPSLDDATFENMPDEIAEAYESMKDKRTMISM
jgi:hypothetical protein